MEIIFCFCFLSYLSLIQLPLACFAMTATNISTDLSSLLSLKDHITSDPHEFLAQNWSAVSSSFCEWMGVACSSPYHRVTALNISNKHLTGTIPPQLGNLYFLVSLDLSRNNFHGNLPRELSQLQRLEVLNLTGNGFSGEIPSWLGSLPRLQNLLLKRNYFTGLIPPAIFNISSLVELRLSFNSLQGSIPEKICNLPSLKILAIGYNQLSGFVPPQLFNISSLQTISLAANELYGTLPDDICDNLGGLRILELSRVKFDGPILSILSNCSQLGVLSLAHSNIGGVILEEIGKLRALKRLYLGYNNLTGFIAREFGNLTMLTVLYLNDNHLTGLIPRELGNLYNLRKLSLAYNNLRGPIPMDELAKCKKLTRFRISNNPLDGVLLHSIGNLSSSIQEFEASNCRINGKIPDTIGNLRSLVILDLSWNGLSGPIPLSVKVLQELQTLHLGGNKLNGVMNIDRLCGLHSLYDVCMENNEISGTIPECLGNLPSLRHLSLGSNRLAGTIPASLWSLSDLLELNLSTNFLSGSLPAELGNTKAAILIDLSMNNISGSLPVSIGDLQNLQILHLVGNKIQGSIPETMGDMVSLESLNLSHNSLSGPIPNSLEKLLRLKYFNVSSNYLNGEIPDGGLFSNFTGESFAFNEALCGAERFLVPPCPTRSNKRMAFGIVFGLLGVAACTGALALRFVYLRYGKKNNAENQMESWPPAPGTHERISYYELLLATDRYDEKNLLGTGSFGSVYKGILNDGRIVAVKVFTSQSERASRSFDVECMVLRQLRHRNLTKVISSCCNPNFRALVLEFMINGCLEQWLYSQNYFLNLMQRLNIMVDVAYALDYLHSGCSTLIVHCDLKPGNILLDQDMVAHVSDFGLAKLLTHEDSMAQTQTLATLGYLAPEYGLEGSVSTKSDVYSYGILLMEVFTRKKPNDDMFEGNLNIRSWVDSAVHNSLAPVIDAHLLSAEGKNYDDMLVCVSSVMELALNCTRESPKERYTMAEVIAALERIELQLQPHYTKTTT